jgi:hypothetical protein
MKEEMDDNLILKGVMRSGKEEYGNHRGIHPTSINDIIAKIKFKRTILRLIKMIKSK